MHRKGKTGGIKELGSNLTNFSSHQPFCEWLIPPSHHGIPFCEWTHNMRLEIKLSSPTQIQLGFPINPTHCSHNYYFPFLYDSLHSWSFSKFWFWGEAATQNVCNPVSIGGIDLFLQSQISWLIIIIISSGSWLKWNLNILKQWRISRGSYGKEKGDHRSWNC